MCVGGCESRRKKVMLLYQSTFDLTKTTATAYGELRLCSVFPFSSMTKTRFTAETLWETRIWQIKRLTLQGCHKILLEGYTLAQEGDRAILKLVHYATGGRRMRCKARKSLLAHKRNRLGANVQRKERVRNYQTFHPEHRKKEL